MLTDAQIAILCDIGQASSFNEEKKGEVLSLVIRGYVEKDGDLFKVTPRGEKVLTDRGAGLNEIISSVPLLGAPPNITPQSDLAKGAEWFKRVLARLARQGL